MARGRIAGIFPIGDTGEEFIVAEWHPDPEIIEAELIKMANAFEDFEAPLEEARELMIENTRILFEEQRDPFWRPWVPLDPEYEYQKRRAGKGDKGILQREGDLYDAATSEEAWLITEDSIMFDVGALPEYGAAHQSGTGRKGTTGFHRIMRTQTPTQIGELIKRDPKIGRALSAFEGNEGTGNNLPQRMFIGATEATISEIEAAFLRHLQRTVIDPWGERISIDEFGMGSNIHGEFPIIGHTASGQPLLRTPKGIRFGRMQ